MSATEPRMSGMATSSARLLRLLSLLGTRAAWSGQELASRLEVSTRTVRRDVDSLRELGYLVTASMGPDGGYALDPSENLPPLLLDDEQALAIAVALQAAPRVVSGIDDAVARALTNLEQVMSPALRAEAEAVHLTVAWNSWEFHGPPIPSATLTAVGSAVRNQHVFRFDLLTPDGRRPHPRDRDFTPPLVVEPHHLVLWAGRWYLVAHGLGAGEAWTVYRLDCIHPLDATGIRFERRDDTGLDVAQLVRSAWDRGDTVAEWPCIGVVLMDLPADMVAQWLPGGAVVEPFTPSRCQVTLGAWSWSGVIGLLTTFGADVEVVEPPELREEFRLIGERLGRAALMPSRGHGGHVVRRHDVGTADSAPSKGSPLERGRPAAAIARTSP